MCMLHFFWLSIRLFVFSFKQKGNFLNQQSTYMLVLHNVFVKNQYDLFHQELFVPFIIIFLQYKLVKMGQTYLRNTVCKPCSL